MAHYGLPYMGSKAKHMPKIFRLFPAANNFYDLFGGGFSVTHFMLNHRNKDYQEFHFNEIRPGMCEFIKDAINGKYSYENKPKFISRAEFFKRKDTDPYVKMIWSFGNNGNTYLFGQDIEEYKHAMHQCVMFGEFNELSRAALGLNEWPDKISTIKARRLYLRNKIEFWRKTKNIPKELHRFIKNFDAQTQRRLEQLEQLQQLERLGQLEPLNKRIDKLNFYSFDYKKVPIKDNSVIYCDIPYKGTEEYDSPFSHKEFYDWADSQTNPVYISEYKNDDKRFTLLRSFKVKSILSSKGPTSAVERVYGNKIATKLAQQTNT